MIESISMTEESTKAKRLSLTKKQLEEPEALELLALLQSVTSDGKVLDDEIAELNRWLTDNHTSVLPAVVYLRESITHILADGQVSSEERAWLQKAVETVLPKEERQFAAMRRREANAELRAAEKEEKAQEKEAAKRDKPIARFDFMVAGVHHEGRGPLVEAHCRAGQPVFLVRDLDNRYSKNATLIRLSTGHDIGFVPESDAVHLAPLLDQGALQSAAIKKILSGRKAPIPVVWGELYQADASVEGAMPMSAAPRAASSSRIGCLLVVLLVIAAIVYYMV